MALDQFAFDLNLIGFTEQEVKTPTWTILRINVFDRKASQTKLMTDNELKYDGKSLVRAEIRRKFIAFALPILAKAVD